MKGRMGKKVRLFLFRHGESQANLKMTEFVTGRSSHSPLSSKGEEQARKLGVHFKDTSFHTLYSSTAVRAFSTANFFTKELNQQIDFTRYEELEEIDMGDFVNKRREEVYNEETVKRIDENPWHFKPPNGESQYEVELRIKNFLDENVVLKIDSLIDENDEEEFTNIGIFGHGLLFKCFIRYVLNSEPENTWKIPLDNTSFSVFEYHPLSSWQLIHLNQTPHLSS